MTTTLGDEYALGDSRLRVVRVWTDDPMSRFQVAAVHEGREYPYLMGVQHEHLIAHGWRSEKKGA
jgi:hypothetical protein